MLNQRIAIVTGAAGTIGQGIVERLLADGRRVCMVDIDGARLSAAARSFPEGSVIEVVTDICAADGPSRIDAAIRSAWGQASILINNAGITSFTHSCEVGHEEWARVNAINVTAPLRLIAHFLPFMKRKGWGRIVNISSRAGRSNPNTAGVAYVASKAAVLGLTRAVATEAGPFGVTCNSVAPGFVETDMSRQLTPAAIQTLLERTPLGRAGTQRELGAAVAYLASEDAGFVTGSCLDVNGGQSMM